jgi:sugar lactone lactonase YvrE
MTSALIGITLTAVAAIAGADDLLVSSRFTDNVLRFDSATGEFRSVFAEGNGLDNPNGIAYGPDGHLYVGLGDIGRVLRFNGMTGTFIDAFVTDDPSTAADETGGLSGCRAIAFGPDGDLYVNDGPNDRVLRYKGTYGFFVGVATGESVLRGPVGLTFGADGTMYVGAALSNGAYAFRNGVQQRRYVCAGQVATTGVLLDAEGRLYAADSVRNAVYRFNTQTGECLGVFASGGGLNIPIGLAWAPEGNLLVGSFNTNSVIRYDGTTGAPLGTLVAPGAGGLTGTHNLVFPQFPPGLRVITPAHNATIVNGATIVAEVQHFTVDCTSGAMRVSVDGEIDHLSCSTSTFLRRTYAPGPHSIQLWLTHADGEPISPSLVLSFPVIVSADGSPGVRRRSVRH